MPSSLKNKSGFDSGNKHFLQYFSSIIYLFLIKKGNKRFAMPSANYLWPQLLNKWTRNSIEENGGEVVLEEDFHLSYPFVFIVTFIFSNPKLDYLTEC